MKNRSSVMKKTTTFMKKSYETLNTTPIGLIPECDILGASIQIERNVTVEAYRVEAPFEIDLDANKKGYEISFE